MDYRKLNAMTVPVIYPMPRIQDILASFKSTKFISTMDLSNAYHQVAMHPADRAKTAFITQRGHYEWNVLPFGCVNATSTFQGLVDKIFRYATSDHLP